MDAEGFAAMGRMWAAGLAMATTSLDALHTGVIPAHRFGNHRSVDSWCSDGSRLLRSAGMTVEVRCRLLRRLQRHWLPARDPECSRPHEQEAQAGIAHRPE